MDGSLAWHVGGLGLVSGGDAQIELDGHPRSVELWATDFYPKGTPSVFESTYTYDGFDQPPPPSPPLPPAVRTGRRCGGLRAAYRPLARDWV